MPGLKEPRAQRWRALYIAKNTQSGLLYLGMSFTQVMENYEDTFFSYLTEEEQNSVQRILLQKFIGLADKGRWETQKAISIPTRYEDDLKIAIKST